MKLNIKVEVDGRVLFIGRKGSLWVVSDKEDTDEQGAAVLETSEKDFGIYESAKEFNKMKENYAHFEPGECN